MDKLVNQSELARIAGVSKQAVKTALDKGQLPFELDGKKKKFNLTHPLIQDYINDDNLNREKAKDKKQQKSSKLPAKKKLKTKPPSKLPKAKTPENVDVAKFEDLDPLEMKRRQQFAEMRRKELQVLILEKKYLPIEFIDGVYIKYIEVLNSNIERMASTFINDVGKKILEAGEILPEHIEMFTNLILESIHNNKKTVKRVVQKYDPTV